jgi:pyruvate, orthophosphate dikinase
MTSDRAKGATMARWIRLFTDGDASQRELLGGKGANLAEMTRLGLPIPPGFTITTDACRAYLDADGVVPEGLWDALAVGLKGIERQVGRRFGDAANPLLLSVRSGAAASMPGMMETVLNLGLDDATVAGLAAQAGDDRFAWDSFRRLIQMYGRVVLGVPGARFESGLTAHKRRLGVDHDAALDAPALRAVVDTYRDLVRGVTGRDFPDDPWVQVHGAVEAVFRSWNTARAVAYRREFRISDDLGTAVTVQAMVFGNLGDDCATGVAFTRDPATGERRLVGEYLPNAQGEDVVAGIRTPLALDGLAADPRLAGCGEAGDALHRRARPGVHDRAGPALDAPDARGEAHRHRCCPCRRRDGPGRADCPRRSGPARPARPTEPVAPSDD